MFSVWWSLSRAEKKTRDELRDVRTHMQAQYTAGCSTWLVIHVMNHHVMISFNSYVV